MKNSALLIAFLFVLSAAGDEMEYEDGSSMPETLPESAVPYDTSSTADFELYNDAELLQSAQELAARNRFNEAMARLRQLLISYPDSPLVPRALYDASFYEKDQRAANAYLERLIDEYPESEWAPRAAYRRGEINFILANYKEALAMFDKYLQSDPPPADAFSARFQSALCHMNMQQFESALEIFQRLKQQNRSGKLGARIADAMAECWMQTEEYEKAAQELRWILSNHPNFQAISKITFNLGLCLESTGNTEEATQFYQRVIKNFSHGPEAVLAEIRLNDIATIDRVFARLAAAQPETEDTLATPSLRTNNSLSTPSAATAAESFFLSPPAVRDQSTTPATP